MLDSEAQQKGRFPSWNCPLLEISEQALDSPGIRGAEHPIYPFGHPDAHQHVKGSQESSIEEIYLLRFTGCFPALFGLVIINVH